MEAHQSPRATIPIKESLRASHRLFYRLLYPLLSFSSCVRPSTCISSRSSLLPSRPSQPPTPQLPPPVRPRPPLCPPPNPSRPTACAQKCYALTQAPANGFDLPNHACPWADPTSTQDAVACITRACTSQADVDAAIDYATFVCAAAVRRRNRPHTQLN